MNDLTTTDITALLDEPDVVRIHSIVVEAGLAKAAATAALAFAVYRMWKLAPWDEEEFNVGDMNVSSWHEYREWVSRTVHEHKNTLDNYVQRIEDLVQHGCAREQIARAIISVPSSLDDLRKSEGGKPISNYPLLVEELAELTPDQARARVREEKGLPFFEAALVEQGESEVELVVRRTSNANLTETKVVILFGDGDQAVPTDVIDWVLERLKV